MVAQITDGTAFDKHGRPFRRRRLLPGLVMFAAMAVAALLVWVIALSRPPDVREAAVCNPPPGALMATQSMVPRSLFTTSVASAWRPGP